MSRDGHASSATTSATDALDGRVLDGRYRIGPRIARGGMATVHEAHDLRLDRRIAVKVMHPGLSDAVGPGERDAFAERFAREARSAAKLSHPNVVSVYDQGEDGGVVYLAMELVTGHTLRDTIDQHAPLSPSRALALVEPVLSALSAAHRAGLVHRDVKPENVLIADDGRVKVADFGLARAVSAETTHTATQGVLIGTVSYLAPELVVDGRSDARADVYAAGVVLYELLTGAKPHTGETPIQVAYKHVHTDVPAPSILVPSVPDYVDALVARATARDIDQRSADAGVLLHQLHRVSHALAAGLREEPELTRDLALRTLPGADDTAPEAWADDDLAALGVAPAARSTRPAPADATTAYRDLGSDPDGWGPVPDPVRPPARAGRPSRPGRSRRRGLVLLALALVAAVAIGGGAFWFGWARYSPAPAVVGLSQVAAETELADAGLQVDYTDPVYDSDAEAGMVVSATPDGGAKVLDDDTVTLTLSLGPLLVPQVRGMDEDGAQDALMQRQLVVGESIGRYSETQPEGTVLASRPKSDTELSSGDTVTLVVSQGRRPIPVGDWVGRPAERAQRVLGERRLQVTTTEVFSDTVPAGDVVRQTPGGGTLFRGDTVTLEISLGQELVEVPRVAAFGVSAAQRVLEDAGFDVEVQQDETFYNLGIAVRTDPPGGSMAPIGSTITLIVI